MTDELSAPLGQDRRAKERRPLPLSIFPAFLAAFGILALLVAAWGLLAGVRLGAQRIGAAAPARDFARNPEGNPADRGGPVAEVASGAPYDAQALRTPTAAPPSSKTVTIIDGTSGKRQEIVLPEAPSSHIADQSSARGTERGARARPARERGRPLNSPDLP